MCSRLFSGSFRCSDLVCSSLLCICLLCRCCICSICSICCLLCRICSSSFCCLRCNHFLCRYPRCSCHVIFAGMFGKYSGMLSNCIVGMFGGCCSLFSGMLYVFCYTHSVNFANIFSIFFSSSAFFAMLSDIIDVILGASIQFLAEHANLFPFELSWQVVFQLCQIRRKINAHFCGDTRRFKRGWKQVSHLAIALDILHGICIAEVNIVNQGLGMYFALCCKMRPDSFGFDDIQRQRVPCGSQKSAMQVCNFGHQAEERSICLRPIKAQRH